ncbi:MAG: FAD-dependent oxidoreductase [Acetobacteraceae bacterium]|nr:FAD-dependent oxidoreductase [Acetobacteraceae bacterium]
MQDGNKSGGAEATPQAGWDAAADVGPDTGPAGRAAELYEARRHQLFPTLTAGQIDRLRPLGEVRRWEENALLFEAGKPGPGMFVVLSGRVAVTQRDGLGHDFPVVEQGPGQFLAEVGQLSGRPALVDGRAIGGPVDAILLPPDALRALLVADAELGEIVMRALILRRVALIESGAGGPVLLGPATLPDLLRLEGFLARNGHPHTILDPASDPDAAELLARFAVEPDDLPLALCPDGSVLRNPSEAELARCLGLSEVDTQQVWDVVVVGAGPAGLATAVYAASEGLSVLVLDARAFGGQAGASARIENYLGFPTGISGQALAGRAFTQAQKFGAEVSVPTEVARLICGAARPVLELRDGRRVRARTVVIASGAAYRRPAIPNLARFEGRGVAYWASPVEARLVRGAEVALVGGGNSAGQAAVFLAAHAARVHMLVRGTGLAATMSRYLVERLDALSNLDIHTETEVVALRGGSRDGGLSGLRWRHRGTGEEVERPIRHLFLFVGADPNTGWLADCSVARDPAGFVLTGTALGEEVLRDAAWPGERDGGPAPLETCVPGVFAIGDARAGSVKRVAAAVGEGAAVVAQLHAHLERAAAR